MSTLITDDGNEAWAGTTDRRTRVDRRRPDTTPLAIERRHGERRTYQQGCKCLPCRSANAQYQARFRQAQAQGRHLPRAHVPAARVHKVMLMLRIEGFSNGDVAQLLGWSGNYARIYRAPVVTVRTAAQVLRLYRERCALEQARPSLDR